jgi:hypothetical protein
MNHAADTAEDSAFGSTTEPDPISNVSARVLKSAEPGLEALHSLIHHFDVAKRPITLSQSTVITLISLSDRTQPWANSHTASLAAGLLSSHLATISDRKSFLIDGVLTDYLKPLFSRSRPAAVTASGRKAEFAPDELEREPGLPDDSRRTKPWKYVDLRSIPVLAWALGAEADDGLEGCWHLFVPPLLTLLDDPLTRVRASGLRLAAVFLGKFPGARLRATGLARVFEDAMVPTLGYLPSVTPEEESVVLLDPAYDALLVLAGKLVAELESGKQEEVGKREERRLLDKMMRGGILTGYFHCPENPRIVEVLMRQTGRMVHALGLASVKHLKDLVPMFKGVLTDPFASARLGTMLEGVRALQVVLRNCWPRLVEGVWSEELLASIVLAWLGLLDVNEYRAKHKDDEEGKRKQEVEEIRLELRKTAAMLAAVVKTAGVDLTEKAKPLVDKEPALAELFVYEAFASSGGSDLAKDSELLADKEQAGSLGKNR